jgi:hypothetical protein
MVCGTSHQSWYPQSYPKHSRWSRGHQSRRLQSHSHIIPWLRLHQHEFLCTSFTSFWLPGFQSLWFQLQHQQPVSPHIDYIMLSVDDVMMAVNSLSDIWPEKKLLSTSEWGICLCTPGSVGVGDLLQASMEALDPRMLALDTGAIFILDISLRV